MRIYHLGAAVVLMWAGAVSAQTITADSTGLSKGSVFDIPTLQVYRYKGGVPGGNKLLPRAFLNAPPQISHDIEGFLPITAQSNLCVACHEQRGEWGKKRAAGAPTPIPPSHYTDLRTAPDKVTERLIGARFNCNQCHVAQTNAPALVENTFGARRVR
jgi:cytochrome c-type protein NapB